MTKKILIVITLLLIVIEPSFAAQDRTDRTTTTVTVTDDEVKIGILSWRGPLGFKKRWQATENYLTQTLDRKITFLPLEFKEVLPAVKAGEVDFFTADPSMFISAKNEYGASEVLTMKLSHTDSVGAVLFTRADNHKINKLYDLNQKNSVPYSVGPLAVGRWQKKSSVMRALIRIPSCTPCASLINLSL